MAAAQNNAVATLERQPRSVLVDMSDRYGMEPAAFEATLRATVCKGNVSREEFAAFLLVAKEYRLNPLTKEIYAFPAKGGGIQPIVSIDGWCRIINEQPVLDGIEFEDIADDGKLVAVVCRIYRKDRTRPTVVTEYMAECRRATDVWKTWPARMLRHKALIQCARYAFGFSGIVDPDEYERMVNVTPAKPEARRIHAGFDDPANDEPAHDPTTGEIQDAEVEAVAEAVDAALDGDDLPEALRDAPEPEPAQDARPAPAGDVLAWADDLEGALLDYAGVDPLREDWTARKAELQAADPERFKTLNAAVAKRAQDIGSPA